MGTYEEHMRAADKYRAAVIECKELGVPHQDAQRMADAHESRAQKAIASGAGGGVTIQEGFTGRGPNGPWAAQTGALSAVPACGARDAIRPRIEP